MEKCQAYTNSFFYYEGRVCGYLSCNMVIFNSNFQKNNQTNQKILSRPKTYVMMCSFIGTNFENKVAFFLAYY